MCLLPFLKLLFKIYKVNATDRDELLTQNTVKQECKGEDGGMRRQTPDGGHNKGWRQMPRVLVTSGL